MFKQAIFHLISYSARLLFVEDPLICTKIEKNVKREYNNKTFTNTKLIHAKKNALKQQQNILLVFMIKDSVLTAGQKSKEETNPSTSSILNRRGAVPQHACNPVEFPGNPSTWRKGLNTYFRRSRSTPPSSGCSLLWGSPPPPSSVLDYRMMSFHKDLTFNLSPRFCLYCFAFILKSNGCCLLLRWVNIDSLTESTTFLQ